MNEREREPYAPRTVALVAVGSLVVGFVLVFGGGMALLRPRARDPQSDGASAAAEVAEPGTPASSTRPTSEPGAPAATGVEASSAPVSATPSASPTPTSPGADPGRVTIGPAVVSRCFDQGPAAIAGAQCDRPAALDAHVQTKRAELAACARAGAHGRLAMVLEYRFSTQFARGWGSPVSNIPDPGGVSLCVKRALFPLPFAQMQHAHDRYVVIVPLDW